MASRSGSIVTESLSNNGAKVKQFIVKLMYTGVWRTFQIPESYTLYGLHVAIQNSFGWMDCHCHQFEFQDPANEEEFLTIGIPTGIEELTDGKKVTESWKVPVGEYFKEGLMPFAGYEYDMGDSWEHQIEFEGEFPAEPGKSYPICLGGEMACPPEDCGGIYGYQQILKIFKKKRRTAADKERMQWVYHRTGNPNYDPNHFDTSTVVFHNPEVQLRRRGLGS